MTKFILILFSFLLTHVSSQAADLSLVGASAKEGDSLRFKVQLSAALNRTVYINYYLVKGSAEFDKDLKYKEGRVTLYKGYRAAYISVPTLKDSVIEPNETVTLKIYISPWDAARVLNDSATGVIVDGSAPAPAPSPSPSPTPPPPPAPSPTPSPTPAPAPSPSPTACSTQAHICVGADQTVKTLAQAISQASDGQTIELLPGIYKESVSVNKSNLTIRSANPTNRAILDCKGVSLFQGKGCMVISRTGLIVEHLVVRGARGGNRNEACFRTEPNLNLAMRHVECYDSNNGILTADAPHAPGSDFIIEDVHFHSNGYGDGYSHNFYFSGNCRSLVARRVKSEKANVGHAFKARCANIEVHDSQLYDDGGLDALELPDGGRARVYNTLLFQPNSSNGNIFRHGAESCKYAGDVEFHNSNITNQRSAGGYVRSHCSQIRLYNTQVSPNVQIQSK